ncbi:double-cubane-cluster-containing anaerobic reductase [Thermodesulfovibrio yellowstonii]|uniref:3-hydroxyacyl-ACP dehydratase n=1 Tax=Thermodesulfovibrio yellowstonii TaxID=28262 RepID=A0A9W6GE05_9BACT|nr:double-cubane-cluster-containing anaerobic reductase [Thermodesulfovibrio islandicus]GLI53543.1 3-hydroxyacyl-ACP dehydratase [Thermodesulfovibrio islandicus]
MSKDYTLLWKELGLDLVKHDGLLSVLSDAYKNIYLSQKNRPEGMKYFDFVISEVHGLRIEELYEAKKEKRKIIGTFCVYVPEELVLAVDGAYVGLCAGAEVGFEEAEKYVPRNTCSLIKAFMGFKLSGLCPYVELTDLIVGETTCDGKKKAYEIFAEITKKMYVMEIPNMKQDPDRELWLKEVIKFKNKLEKISGKEITINLLKKATEIVNLKRLALKRLSNLRAYDPPPISGLDALLINQIAFYDDPVRFTMKVNELCNELEERVKKEEGIVPKGTPRIIISGSPFAIPNWKLHAIVENSGAVVVGEESCVGSRNFRELTDENFSSIGEGLEKIAMRYMSIDCACFTPNRERIDNVKKLYKELKADGIIHYALQFCTPYMIEAFKIEKNIGFPYMRIETDYSMEDFGQLKTRVEAFIETLK